MSSVAATFAPSEGRTGELELLRGESRPLKSAQGFVIGGLIAVSFWGLLALAIRLVI